MNKYILNDILSGDMSRPVSAFKKKLISKLFQRPYAIVIEPANFCNLQCPLCPTPSLLNPRKKRMLSFDNFKYILDKVKNVVHRVYLVLAGEPLLNKDLPEMINYARKCKLFTIIFTNATLLNDKLGSDILNSGLDYLIISFDGFSKNVYEDFRCGANFEGVLDNIRNLCALKKKLKAAKTFIEIQWILTKENQPELRAAQKFFKSLPSINRFYIKSLSLNEHCLSLSDIEKYKNKYLPLSGKIRKHYINANKNDNKCLMHIPAILADGSITICCYDFKGEYAFGNILELDSLEELLQSSIYREIRMKSMKRKLPICQKCPSELE